MAARQRLERYLREEGVSFDTVTHPLAYTAQEVAAAQHTPGKQLAKVVLVDADGELVMLVLPASHRADFVKLKPVLKAKKVRLAKEEEFVGTFTDCEVGAMPPFGNLYGMDVFVSESLAEDEEIAFNAGSHVELVRLAYKDFNELAKPKVAGFTY